MTKRIVDVKKFWEKNPLFTGESKYELGSSDFFNEHNRVYVMIVLLAKLINEYYQKQETIHLF
jgi:hypothetical protein